MVNTMKRNKKVIIIALGLSLAAAGIGGIFFQTSPKEPRDLSMGRTLSSSADNLLVISAITGGAVIVLITGMIFIMARDSGGENPVRQEEETGINEINAIEQLIVNINDLSKEINRQAKSISQSMTTIRQDLENIQTVTRNTADSGDQALFDRSQGETFDHIPLAK
jgi:TolA-binding protein